MNSKFTVRTLKCKDTFLNESSTPVVDLTGVRCNLLATKCSFTDDKI